MNITEKNINVKTEKATIDFTMGADPEFCIVDSKSVITGKVLTEGDEFGVDGNGVSFEARPDPSTSPLEVANNIRGIMVRQCLKKPVFLNYDWLAGSWQRDYPLGGHIHFGIKNNQIPFKKATNILSQYVGVVSVLLEDIEQGRKRREKYGHFEDFREQTYGFEYRCPSSWITEPYVASAILCLAKAVMFEVLNNDKFKIPTRIKANHIQEMDIKSLREFWPDIWSEITKMALYPQYKSYLDLLHYLIQKNQSWFPRVSMKEAWGIVDMNSALNSQLQMKAIWHKFAKRNDGFVRK